MKEFAKFKFNVYRVEEMEKYIKQINQGSELGIEVTLEPVPIPKPAIATIEIDPEDISVYFEVYSMDEGQYEDPKFDQTCVVLKNGQEYQVNANLAQFKKELDRIRKKSDKL